MQKIITLANARTTNETLDAVTYDGHLGYADVYFSGNFGGATVEIQAEPLTYTNDAPNVGFVAVAGGEAVQKTGTKRLIVGKNTKIRAVVSNATGTTSISIIAKYDIDIQG
jgi:hypothetical protein